MALPNDRPAEDDDQLDLEGILTAQQDQSDEPPEDEKPPEAPPESVKKEGEGPAPAGPTPVAKPEGGQPPAPGAPPPSTEKPPETAAAPPALPLPAAPPGAQTATPPEDNAKLAELRKAHLDAMAKRYVPSKGEAEALLVEPEKVLPMLLARAHMDAIDAAIAAISAAVPQMVLQVTARQQHETETERAFFTRWPQLNKPELHERIAQTAQVFRSINPKATGQEAIDAVGAQVCYLSGIPIEAKPATPPPPADRSKPPVPTGVGASGGPAQQKSGDFWRDFYEEARKE